MRRAALPIAMIFLAALAAAVALGRVGSGAGEGTQAAVIATAGEIEIANDRDGLPVFAASGIGPGDSARGTVEIAATGSAPARLTLSRHDLLDSPGIGGGLLSQALDLTITDVTDPAAPLPIYAGPLDSMPPRAAGRLEPGVARTYEFVATLPADGGGGDQNALQGASVSVAYTWAATEAGEAGEPGPGGEGGEPGGEATPGGGQGSASEIPSSIPLPADRFELAVTGVAKTLRGRHLVVWAGCDRACAIVVRGRLRASAAGHHRGALLRFGKPGRYRPEGVRKLRILIPAQLRRWLTAAPGRRRLRAHLVFTATDLLGARDAVKREVQLRPPRRR